MVRSLKDQVYSRTRAPKLDLWMEDEMPKRPNFLLVMTDQQRADSVGYAHEMGGAGRRGSDTPHLDGFAHRGVIFDNAYSASTVCVPARNALLTGIFDERLPRVPGGRALKEGCWTIAHAMAHAGYDTGLFGKMHFAPIDARHGFQVVRSCEHLSRAAGYGPEDVDDYRRWLEAKGLADPRQPGATSFPYDEALHPAHWITDQAIDFLEKRQSFQPFFAIVSYTGPHEPYDPPKRYRDMYPWEAEPILAHGFEVNWDLPEVFQQAFAPHADGPFERKMVSALSPERVKRTLAAIRAMIRQIDDQVVRLMSHVSLDDTVVFFTSDHGAWGGHRGLMGKLPWLPFDDLAKVPFFALGVGVEGGRRVAAPVQSCDFAATCLELAGLKPPARLDTESLASVLRGAPEDADRDVFCALSVGWPMIRRRNLKMLWHWIGVEVMYDLESDPGETKNLAPDSPALVKTLRDSLDKQIQQPEMDLWVHPRR
jgi:arylsulfatase